MTFKKPLTTIILSVAIMAFGTGTMAASDNVTPATNPTVPQKVKFAGQEISLDRVDMFERLDRELTAMTYTHGNMLLTIKRANRYFPVIIPILRENGIPDDLVYLACIESYLDTRALSGAKAAGIWQFMSKTAIDYGLEVNDYVDERYNIEKSTAAACRYLKTAYQKYGNWESAAASYNGGMKRISDLLSEQQAKTAYDIYLTGETSRYMFRLLAMKMIMEHPSRYGFHLKADQLYQPLDYDIVEVSGPVDDWTAWAIDHGINFMILRENNPWIRKNTLPNTTGKTYQVKIPSAKSLYRSTQKSHTYNSNWIKK